MSVEGMWARNENLGVTHLEVGGPARERGLGQRTGEGSPLLPLLDLRSRKEF